MTAIACTQPGCGGVIEDGYCTSCGMAPVAAPAASAAPPGATIAPRGAPPRPGPARQRRRPGAGASRLRLRAGQLRADGVPRAVSRVSFRASQRVRQRRRQCHRVGAVGQPPRKPILQRPPVITRRLGAGLVEVPPVPARDPSTAVLANPQVPESKRLLRQLRPAGRARPGRPARAGRGILPQLRHPVLLPAQAGGRRAGRRAVRGARLPGARRPGLDLPGQGPQRQRPLGGAQGPAEHRGRRRDGRRRRRAAVPGRGRAPQHRPDLQLRAACRPAHRRAPVGYIVMEYVGGKSLKQILQDARGRAAGSAAAGAGPRLRDRDLARVRLPARPRAGLLRLQAGQRHPDRGAAQAHRHGRRAADGRRRRPIYGTVGYQAPEIADEGPSPESDLYTVGRALAVLTFDFKGYQGDVPSTSCPTEVPLLAQHESFRRLLARATHPDPARRFASAGEMARPAHRSAARGARRSVTARPRPVVLPRVQPGAARASGPTGPPSRRPPRT